MTSKRIMVICILSILLFYGALAVKFLEGEQRRSDLTVYAGYISERLEARIGENEVSSNARKSINDAKHFDTGLSRRTLSIISGLLFVLFLIAPIPFIMKRLKAFQINKFYALIWLIPIIPISIPVIQIFLTWLISSDHRMNSVRNKLGGSRVP